MVATTAAVMVIILHTISWAMSQNFQLLPMGGFRWIWPIDNGERVAVSTISPFQTLAQSIDRPQVDTVLPPGIDAAVVSANDTRVISFINSCPRQIELAYLRCPCSRPGTPCADPLSLCNLENKCVCDGRFGYADRTGTKCTAYATTTRTSTPNTTTGTTTTVSTTATTTTTPTTLTSTTSMTTTAIPPPTRIFSVCEDEDGNPLPTGTDVPSGDRTDLVSRRYPDGFTVELNCLVLLRPSSGKRIRLDFLDFNIDSEPPDATQCESSRGLIAIRADESSSDPPVLYCSTVNPPPTFLIFEKDITPQVDFVAPPGVSADGPYRFRIRVTSVD